MTDEFIELRPPNAQHVARRALILSAIVCRGSIDKGVGDPHAEELPGRIRNWLERAGLVDHLEPAEAEIIRASLGEIGQRQVYWATWAVEGLVVVAWALGCSELPTHDQQVNPFAITDSLDFLSDDAEAFVATARLRSAQEFHDYRELMYAVHCRLRGFLRERDPHDFSTWVEDEWLEMLQLERAHLIVDGDLGIDGKPIAAATREAVQRCEWAICERHRASIWLVGEEYPNYWG